VVSVSEPPQAAKRNRIKTKNGTFFIALKNFEL